MRKILPRLKQVFLLHLLCCFLAGHLTAQTGERVITGIVRARTDSAGLQGVSILVKGHERIATRTDAEGKFRLTVPADTRSLMFSNVGMETREVSLEGGAGFLQIFLYTSVQSLNDVVVVGYGTQ